MPNPVKEETVRELSEVFQKAKAAVLADYKGIDAPRITALRAHMRDRSVMFRVVKNTLALRAAKNTPFEELGSHFKGPVSLAVSLEDPVAPAKALADYAKVEAKMSPKVLCGVVEGKLISAEEVKALSELPSKEVLIAKMLATFQGPTTNLVGVLNGLLRKLVGTLDAIREKKASG
ncbi:MAG: 50S ribosomal protein L10 [Nitrospinaceae bacterium]